MRLRVTRRAAGDIVAIADYILERDPAAAIRVRASLITSLTLISRFPRIGRAQSLAGVRKFVSRPYRYAIYYSVGANEIAIVTIQHPARDPATPALT